MCTLRDGIQSVAGNCLRAVNGAIVDLAVVRCDEFSPGRADMPSWSPSSSAQSLCRRRGPDVNHPATGEVIPGSRATLRVHPCVSLESHSSSKQLRSWTLTGQRDVGCGRSVAHVGLK